MGFITLMAKEDNILNETELFHFLEFIHYLIFLTMCYYMASVVIMVSTSVLLCKQETNQPFTICVVNNFTLLSIAGVYEHTLPPALGQHEFR
jgi:hypothetical protein